MAVYMDTDAVQHIADGFETAADVLGAVNTALEAAMQLLRMTAFVGLVGGLALERYIASIQNFINGDEEGASRFY
jgi:hypothetical protein